MKKQAQLGMNPGTASNRLVKDILFHFVKESGAGCFQCGKPMLREDFSIEHKEPWLDSENPREMFFDLNNISFSHRKCNSEERRIKYTAKCGTHSQYTRGCRCNECKLAHAEHAKSGYTPEARAARYARNGK